MARIAIIHIRDDHTADDMMTASLPPGARWVGFYQFPDRAELKCSGYCTRKGTSAWGRDKLGFMRCSICGSRNKKIRRWFVGALFDYFGANLYPDAPALFRTPEGYGPPRDTN